MSNHRKNSRCTSLYRNKEYRFFRKIHILVSWSCCGQNHVYRKTDIQTDGQDVSNIPQTSFAGGGGIKYKHAGVMSFNNFLVFLTYSTKQQIGKELSIASLFALPWCRTPTFTIVVSHKINTPILDIGRNCSSSILKVKKNVKMLKVNTRNQTRTDYISWLT